MRPRRSAIMIVPAHRPPCHRAFSLLQVPPDASLGEVRRAYYALAKECHPDILPPDATDAQREQAHRQFIALAAEFDRRSGKAPATADDDAGDGWSDEDAAMDSAFETFFGACAHEDPSLESQLRQELQDAVDMGGGPGTPDRGGWWYMATVMAAQSDDGDEEAAKVRRLVARKKQIEAGRQ